MIEDLPQVAQGMDNMPGDPVPACKKLLSCAMLKSVVC